MFTGHSVRHASLTLDAPVEGRVQDNPQLSMTSVWYVHLADILDCSGGLRASSVSDISVVPPVVDVSVPSPTSAVHTVDSAVVPPVAVVVMPPPASPLVHTQMVVVSQVVV